MMGHAAIVPSARLHDFAREALVCAGVPEEDAVVVADVLVDADLAGITTHGVTLLPRYVGRIGRGGLVSRPRIEVVRQRGAVCVLDGGGGMGHVVATRAMDRAIDLARTHGIGAVGVRSSDHLGPAGFYAARATRHDMIGNVMTNAPAVMAAHGGSAAVIGNNPIAYAIPRGEHPPIIVDIACSIVAKGKVRVAAQEGQAIPADWAVDAEGRPTTDPSAAMEGAVLPLAGHKGYALALVGEILAGVLPGALVGLQIPRGMSMGRQQDDPWGVGHWVTAIDIEAFRPLEDFHRALERLVADLRNSAGAGDEVLLPGEPEERSRQVRGREGIPVSTAVATRLHDLARELGIEPLTNGDQTSAD